MNFIPIRLESEGDALAAKLPNGTALPIPADRVQRYKPVAANGKLSLGLRPEHITELRPEMGPGVVPITVPVDVTEPMGMETLVYFKIEGSEVCARVSPKAGIKEGAAAQLAADLNNMHIIDESTGRVV
jgi:multiple sugar transport system ATP-binding protein